ncbi:MAG: helix-turn-helix transcriptional regulator [Actinobacteria bacterium]|nr:helix-turn-helix transcriptional regulator [Actinomycetota bacterium]
MPARHQRFVHPLITEAVVRGLRRAGADLAWLPAAAHEGQPVDEVLHTRLKALLLETAGPWGMVDAGHHLGRHGDHPVVAFLATSRAPAELLHRFDRMEPLLHLGNRTRSAMGDRRVEVRHEGRGHRGPGLAESLFVCGAQVGMLQRIGCRGVSATVGGVTVWPPERRPQITPRRTWDEPPSAGDAPTWVAWWRSGPRIEAPTSTGSVAADVRRLVADQPAADWTLAVVAADRLVSTRTLQRQLQAEGHRLAGLVLEGRMDAAEALLRRTKLPATMIAYLCGFADPAHLSRTSRRLRGVPPSGLRSEVVSGRWPGR